MHKHLLFAAKNKEVGRLNFKKYYLKRIIDKMFDFIHGRVFASCSKYNI